MYGVYRFHYCFRITIRFSSARKSEENDNYVCWYIISYSGNPRSLEFAYTRNRILPVSKIIFMHKISLKSTTISSLYYYALSTNFFFSVSFVPHLYNKRRQQQQHHHTPTMKGLIWNKVLNVYVYWKDKITRYNTWIL